MVKTCYSFSADAIDDLLLLPVASAAPFHSSPGNAKRFLPRPLFSHPKGPFSSSHPSSIDSLDTLADMLFSKSIVGLVVAAFTATAAPSKPVEKDVIVVGGGASGAHAAVRLRDDYGLSVALIEKQDILVCDIGSRPFYNQR